MPCTTHTLAVRASSALALRRRRNTCICRAELDKFRSESNFEDQSPSSRVSKGIVSGLTAAVNLVIPAQTDVIKRSSGIELKPEDVRTGVERDFTENDYLWTGDINVDIYADDCTFTDPTISFKGLATFQRNLESLRWFIDRLVDKYNVELYSCELDEEACKVVASWRMTGDFRFPWKPALDLKGQTTFTYAPDQGNRIVSYDEEWGITAADALKQLIRPKPAP